MIVYQNSSIRADSKSDQVIRSWNTGQGHETIPQLLRSVCVRLSLNFIWFESETYIRTCAPSEDSDQTAHSRSLIRIFPGRILDTQGRKVFFMWTTKTDQTVHMRWVIWVFVWCTCQKVHFLTLRLICITHTSIFKQKFRKQVNRFCNSVPLVSGIHALERCDRLVPLKQNDIFYI